jgi:nitronate monooxygenase
MWPDRRLTDLLEIEHPLVLAPMAGFGTVELAAAVCSAGGLGSIGCGPVPPSAAAKTIAELRALTNKPINVNFFSHAPAKADAGRERSWFDRLSAYYRELGIDAEPPPTRVDLPPFGDDMCKVVEDASPDVVSFHFGLPAPALLARIKAAGCRVMASATTVAEARWLEARGVDVVIAQGYEAGGHRGMFLASDLDAALATQSGAMALVPQIVDAVSIPVVAAGGSPTAAALPLRLRSARAARRSGPPTCSVRKRRHRCCTATPCGRRTRTQPCSPMCSPAGPRACCRTGCPASSVR